MSVSQLSDLSSCFAVKAQPLLKSGLASGLTWSTPDGSGVSTATITITGLTSSNIITATLQDGTEADALACWLVKATPSTDIITFYCAGQPTTPSSFTISWQISNPIA